MKIIGMTGPTGSGKTTVARFFTEKNIPVIITDKVAQEITEPGTRALDEIVSAFGEEMLNPDGTLNRAALAEIVFNDPDKNKLLCDITHPFITITIRKMVKALMGEGHQTVVLDAPLLFESGIHKHCHFVFSVLADRAIRKARIIARDALSDEAAEERLSAQPDDDYYILQSDIVVTNNGDIKNLKAQMERLFKTFGIA